MADTPRRALTLRDLMTSRLVAASPDESVADAAEAMVRQRVGSALIMQGSFLAGILTERDVLRAAASGSDLTASPVSAWMTKDPEQASLDTTIEDAAQLMLLHGFRHLPVVEGREVRGVVSLRDLAAARITRPASGGAGQTVAHLPVNKSQSVKKRQIYRFFFTSGEKFTSREIFTGKAAGSWGA